MRHSPSYCVGRKSCISRHNSPMPFTETKMDDAYAWLCHRRRRFPPNADVWHLRFHWAREKFAAHWHRLYEQKRSHPERRGFLGDYVRLWQRWTTAGIGPVTWERQALRTLKTPLESGAGNAKHRRSYARALRLATPTNPTSPVPNSHTAAGIGTAEGRIRAEPLKVSAETSFALDKKL